LPLQGKRNPTELAHFNGTQKNFVGKACIAVLLHTGSRPMKFPVTFLLSASIGLQAVAGPVRFNRDIRPILSDKCFVCHGPDEKKRKANLRLDTEGGLAKALIPGQEGKSELYLRITHKDPEETMPPPDSGKPLSAKERELVRQWIREGAGWEGHWAWIPPVKPPVPDILGITDTDRFLNRRIQADGAEFAPQADPHTLVRRLHLDITGLPPGPEVVRKFVNAPSREAYSRIVDGLLASPHFGERLAIMWLDLVRYADSVGYHKDRLRECWMYRDYIIGAFNDNMPYDRFIVEQLAGDLLKWDKPAPNQYLVASGLNRMIQTTSEGGAQAKEYIAKYAADRVRNTAAIFLGTTMGCAECHDHKYDPFSMKDFYSMAAFFADIKESGVGYPAHTPMPTEQILAEKARLEGELANASDSEEKKTLEEALKKVSDTKTWPQTLVTMRAAPRVIRVLPRGNWLDDSGEERLPAIPAYFGEIDTGEERATRLDLAKWIASDKNPLTARVFVNRVWKLYFGKGLSRNLDDFGAQGDWPTHPELLDWLAVDFMENGWDIKRLVRQIVMTEAYQRSSAHPSSGELFEKQTAFRLEAELVRDNALAISGLLSSKIGGRSVKPYQPANYWFRLYNTGRYDQDHGEELYRRGVYTLWRRSFWHPSLQAFDAPSREECVANRPISNTPLQALVLLNDPTFVEAAKAFASRLLMLGEMDASGRLAEAYRLALSREPSDEETHILLSLLAKHHSAFSSDAKAAQELLANGESKSDPKLDPVELAAWTSVARTILNLHETITRD
jgi:hypothetical protein